MVTPTLSPRRQSLASFENAYAVAVQIRDTSGVDQFIVATGNALQPYRVTPDQPDPQETLLARVA